MKLALILAFASISNIVSALSATEWRSQSIYQLLTDRFARTDGSLIAKCVEKEKEYCGGSWRGIIQNLDYIQGMGFTAIWISPIVEQIDGITTDGSGYHGYWAKNIYQVNPNFGTEADLVALSDALHQRGMYLMVDVVPNHMAYLGPGTSVDYSGLTPFNDKKYFHDFCFVDYSNITSIQNCWLGSNVVSLPDLRTEDDVVFDIWIQWIKDLVAKYNIDGLRLDSTQQLNTAFLKPFEAASGIFVMGEVFSGDVPRVCSFQEELSGLINFPNYFNIFQAFETTFGSMSRMVDGLNAMKTTCKDITVWGSFLENHDVARFAFLNSDTSLLKNALSATLLADGIPVVYYGVEQGFNGYNDPYNRKALWQSGYDTSTPLYSLIRKLITLRQHVSSSTLSIPIEVNVIAHLAHRSNHRQMHARNSLESRTLPQSYLTTLANVIYNDTSTVVMRKREVISVYTNLGDSSGEYTLSLNRNSSRFVPGQTFVEILDCVSYTVDRLGSLKIGMKKGLPRVLIPDKTLKGSNLCPDGISTTTLPQATSPPASTCTPVTYKLNVAVDSSIFAPNSSTVIKVAGELPAFGSWDLPEAVVMSNGNSTSTTSIWSTTFDLLPGPRLAYKYIAVDRTGNVIIEPGPNRAVRVSSENGCPTEGIETHETWDNRAV